MTLSICAASRGWTSAAAVAMAAVWCGACALPRGGISAEGGRPLPDATLDSGVDAGVVCEPADCNDGNPCTDDLCTATGCEHLANTSGCDDGVFCNGVDSCAEGVCRSGPGDPCAPPSVCDESRHACVQCASPADCDDANPCTDDGCSAGSCTHSNNTALCDDGDACTVGDVCGGGSCSGTPMSCDDGNACTADMCSGGSCSHADVADGTGCPGGVCTDGTCVGCASDADCLDPAFAACDAGTGMCIPCTDGYQCTHLAATGICDRSRLPRACVSSCSSGCAFANICAPGTNSTRCGSGGSACVDCTAMGLRCDAATHTCM